MTLNDDVIGDQNGLGKPQQQLATLHFYQKNL
jgi:hypothetical protein